ncbi:MAG: cobalt ECF transporter T component CbiQ [Chloroflexota bacterium]|nr:cobalt ECF transporter T component CbiQ [Chloroflexota bacterium]
MNFALDEYAHLNSILHRWDPRFKLIGFAGLIFAFSFVQDLYVLPAMALVTGAIFLISRLPVSFVLYRLRYPSIFLLMVILILPFLSGETVIFSIGPLDVREEGLVSVLLIATRFLCILTLGLILFGTAPFLTTIKAMRALGLPPILADMTLLTFRYLSEIGDYLHRMEAALRLRGFNARRFSFHGLGTLSWLGGSILVRSYERSEWVYKAMIMRGYGQRKSSGEGFEYSIFDSMVLGIALLLAAGFVAAQIVL